MSLKTLSSSNPIVTIHQVERSIEDIKDCVDTLNIPIGGAILLFSGLADQLLINGMSVRQPHFIIKREDVDYDYTQYLGNIDFKTVDGFVVYYGVVEVLIQPITINCNL